jgi:hypothetical protein
LLKALYSRWYLLSGAYMHTYIHTYIHTLTHIKSLPTYMHTYIHSVLASLCFLYIHTCTSSHLCHTYIHTYIHTIHTFIHTCSVVDSLRVKPGSQNTKASFIHEPTDPPSLLIVLARAMRHSCLNFTKNLFGGAPKGFGMNGFLDCKIKNKRTDAVLMIYNVIC